MYSVLIPSLGRFEYLNELCETIKKQTLQAKEIIFLLDDNNFCRKNSNNLNCSNECKIVFCKNLNLAAKRNYGAKIAVTDFLFFSDDDDLWVPNKAEICLKEIEKNSVLIHDFTKFGLWEQKPQLLHGSEIRNVSLSSLLTGTNVWGGGSSIVAKKELVLNINFKESLNTADDYDWFVRLLLSDIKIKYLPFPLVKYRTHNNNMTKSLINHNLVNIKCNLALSKKSIYLLLGSIVGISKSFFHILFSFLPTKPYFMTLNKIKFMIRKISKFKIF